MCYCFLLQRKHDALQWDSEVDAMGESKEPLWRVNFEEFINRLRIKVYFAFGFLQTWLVASVNVYTIFSLMLFLLHGPFYLKACIEYVKAEYDTTTAMILSSMLEGTKCMENTGAVLINFNLYSSPANALLVDSCSSLFDQLIPRIFSLPSNQLHLLTSVIYLPAQLVECLKFGNTS